MGYDMLLFSLTAVGIVSVAILSYKIAHSRVYPIGIVRRMPSLPVVEEHPIRTYIDESGEQCHLATDFENVVDEQSLHFTLGVSEEKAAQYPRQSINLKTGVGKSFAVFKLR